MDEGENIHKKRRSEVYVSVYIYQGVTTTSSERQTETYRGVIVVTWC